MDHQCSFPGCPRPRKALGLCDGHYKQASKGHPLRPIKPRSHNRLADLLAELYILAGTDTVRSLAERLGYSNPRGAEKNLYRVLHRAGRDDLWRRLREMEAA